jgi:amidase
MKHFLLSIAVVMLTLSACSPMSSAPESKSLEDDNELSFKAAGIIAKPLPDIMRALESGEYSSAELVELYLARIEQVDKNGPALQAILSLNADALAEARLRDEERARGKILGPLHGVPIVLKDNIESKDNIATTAGALALKYNITGRDSPLVAGLRAQGAIILGKTNLSQWANFRSENSMSGWSALGGQVRNPHILDRNPCGSSAGSGVATAASLAAASVGTETNGSIICPANASGIVGFKPTVGIVSQQYIIPISVSQDTAGPMTKSVLGAAIMMNAMATGTPNTDYTAQLNKNALSGVRVGVLNFATGNSVKIRERFAIALDDLEKAGAQLVYIDKRPTQPDGYSKMTYDILKYEFKDGINKYLASTSLEYVKTRSLKELIVFNEANKHIEMPLFDQSIFAASELMGSLNSDEYKTAIEVVQRTTRKEGIDKLLEEYDVAVLVAPYGLLAPRVDPINGDVWPNVWPGYGSHAARAGYPHITVPMGNIDSLSVGLSFISGYKLDAKLLGYAFAYEQQSMRIFEPQYLNNAEDISSIATAMAPYKGD